MDRRSANRRLLGKLSLVAVGMFAFGVFGMPPLYDRFCEFVGIGQAGVRTADSAPEGSAADRTVRIRFDATTNSALHWEFRPKVGSMDVTVGEPVEALYTVHNLEGGDVVGRAVYNVTPPAAGLYFVKTECFCFTSQGLEAGQSKDMPVRFYIDPDLPEDVTELTLSYTFFLDQQEPGVAGLDPQENNLN